MVLADLGNKITDALANFKRSATVDHKAFDQLLKDVCNALILSDVNIKLVAQLRNNIKSSINLDEVSRGQNKKRLVESALCSELVALLNPETKPWIPHKNSCNIVMFVGLQGSGKTTSCTKYAYYYMKKGWKTAIVCADTFRAGAFDQLKQNCVMAGIPFYGSYDESDPAIIAAQGVQKFKEQRFELVIIDTSGRHKQQAELFEEMKAVSTAVEPDSVVFVMDASIGQACEAHATAFRQSVDVGSVIVTKLDSHAKGGGALSAIAATNSPITFIGTGEHLTDFEPFKTESFVSKLLGRGDLQGLIEVMETFNKTVDMASLEKDLKKGKFTIRNMQEQFSALMNIGPLDQFLSMIPGLKPEMFGLVKGLNQNSKEEGLSTVIRSWMTVVDSMSSKELDHPEPAQLFKKEKSRVVRIARGSGRSFTETSETIKKMSQMQNTFKKLGPILSQFKGGAMHSGGTNTMPDSGQMARMNSELMKMMNPQMLKQMGGQTGLSEMMKNLSKIDKRSLSGMKF